MGFSLSFFSNITPPNDFWGHGPEIARAAEQRARAVGCIPIEDAFTFHGIPTAWDGPSVGEVVHRLSKLESKARDARSEAEDGVK